LSAAHNNKKREEDQRRKAREGKGSNQTVDPLGALFRRVSRKEGHLSIWLLDLKRELLGIDKGNHATLKVQRFQGEHIGFCICNEKRIRTDQGRRKVRKEKERRRKRAVLGRRIGASDLIWRLMFSTEQ